MKLFFIVLGLMSLHAKAQHQLELTIQGIENVQGTVLVAVYNSEDSFMKKHVLSARKKVSAKSVTVVLDNVSPGNYAISTFHDENDNEKLDTNFLGIPVEPYGFSNNARGAFGPPAFEKAKVMVDGDKKLTITLR